jgi:hypothetical protein
MNLAQLDLLFTEVSRKHHVKTFVVMGSLTVLALINERAIPNAMIVSAEVDAYPESDPARAFEIADDFGLGSDFEQANGYYYDAVSPSLPTFPRGWEQRLIPIALPGGTLAKFIEPHDAAIAKYSRGAPKDMQWIRAGIDASILSVATLEYRFRETVFADGPERERVREAIAKETVRARSRAGPRRKKSTLTRL